MHAHMQTHVNTHAHVNACAHTSVVNPSKGFQPACTHSVLTVGKNRTLPSILVEKKGTKGPQDDTTEEEPTGATTAGEPTGGATTTDVPTDATTVCNGIAADFEHGAFNVFLQHSPVSSNVHHARVHSFRHVYLNIVGHSVL